jgi:REP element-mobilizing transposase RayT
MQMNHDGRIVVQEWENTSRLRTDTHLDVYVVMPNHFHAILLLEEGHRSTVSRALESNTESFGKPVSGSVPTIVRSFKSAVTRRINRRRGTSGSVVWQRNYYEHIIRNDDEFESIREYILLNPVRWGSEKDMPEAPYRKGEGNMRGGWAIRG